MGNREELLRKRQIREEGGDPYATPQPLDESERLVADLATRAVDIEVKHQAFEEAIMDEREVAARLLKHAIKNIMPALPALVGKLEADSSKTTGSNDHVVTHHAKRGVILVDKFHVTHVDRDLSGTYGGVALYLLEDGNLAIGHRDGTWTRAAGKKSVLSLCLIEADVDAVLARFRVDQILAGMVTALNNQEGLVGATERVRARAAKLAVAINAITDMLR